MKVVQLEKKLLYILIVFLSLLFVSCNKNDDSPVEPPVEKRGDVISATSLGTYSTSLLQLIVNSQIGSTAQSITLQYEVEAFKIIYRTIDSKGNLVTASGALSIPKGKNNLSLISLHHGTVTSRTQVPSQNPYNTFVGLIAASLGYYSLEPDYLGLGESDLLHPYHYQKSSAEAVIDFIRACKSYAATKGITLNGQVFLAGYSEGGYVTLAAHKEIEQNYRNEITVTASSPMAGAYDLNLTARTILQQSTYGQPSYLSFFFVAYNSIYGWNKINDVFNSPYAEKIPTLFDGTKTTDQINASLTTSINQLFKQSFLTAFLNGTEPTITNAFTDNSLINWTPSAPIRFYHGNADEYVPYENSTKARDYFKALGANVELVTINGGTHQSAAVPSILDAIMWFESIRLKKQVYAFNY
jgi:predicted esterase